MTEYDRHDIDALTASSGLRFIDSPMADLDYPYDQMKQFEKSHGRLFKKMVFNLYQHMLTFKEVREEFKYVGGDGMTRSLDKKRISTPQQEAHMRYFKLIYGNTPYPEHTTECWCDTQIIENCYIARKTDTNQVLIWGNCCIKRFMISAGRTCESCQAPHKNRKYNLCNDCKPRAPFRR